MIYHFKTRQERLDFIRGKLKFTEIEPKKAKKKTSKKKEKKDEVQTD